MYSIDFEFDGQLLSSLGFIICDFSAPNGANIISSGSDITFNKVSLNSGKKYNLIGTTYDSCISTTFHICKNPDTHDTGEMEIGQSEFRTITRWLCRRSFKKFRFISDNPNDDPCYFNASFNIGKITIADKLYGIELTMETDSPFGYGELVTKSATLSTATDSLMITDESDEIGYVYPDVIITCMGDGDLTLTNETFDSVVVIEGCTSGEVITLYGESQTIYSTKPAHNLSTDFNFAFLKLENTIDNRINEITSTLPCQIVVKYYPVIKDVL